VFISLYKAHINALFCMTIFYIPPLSVTLYLKVSSLSQCNYIFKHWVIVGLFPGLNTRGPQFSRCILTTLPMILSVTDYSFLITLLALVYIPSVFSLLSPHFCCFRACFFLVFVFNFLGF